MSDRRDSLGRITGPLGPFPNPLAEVLPLIRRDARSEGVPRKADTTIHVRIPGMARELLEKVAKQRKVTLSFIVQEALISVTLAALHGSDSHDGKLRDSVPETPISLGLNSKLPRLVPEAQRDPQNSVPSYDKIGRFRQKAGGRPPPTLTDRGRR